MKKLTLLVALILCVTIGGVYATWYYAETQMNDAVHEFKNLGITDVDTRAETGRLEVTDTLILKIDDNAGDHKPAWDDDVNASNAGTIQIVFTPNSGASTTQFKYTISIEGNDYNGQPIFNVADPANILTGTFTYTAGDDKAIHNITLGDITPVLQVNGNIVLGTLADYTAYKNALDGVTLKLTIEEQ